VYYMNSRGQAARRDRGYAMAALLVVLAAMAVAMTVAMPAWRQAAKREKEAELVFRGEQYVRAIRLFQRKYAAAYPPNIDTLVKGKFLRKKYKDPMTEDGEFQVLYVGMMAPGQGGRGAMTPGGAQPGGVQSGAAGRGDTSTTFTFTFDSRSGAVTQSGGGAGPRGGMLGVASKSTEQSLRLYNGRDHYNEWQFVFTPRAFGPGQARPGMGGPRGGPGSNVPGPRGGRGQGSQGSFEPFPGGRGGGVRGGQRGPGGARPQFELIPPGRGR